MLAGGVSEMTLGQKIKKLRSNRDLTQKELADKLHVSFQTVSKWENGENEPDISTLRELAKLFNCSMDFLLSEEEIETREKEPDYSPTKMSEYECAVCGERIPESQLVVNKELKFIDEREKETDFVDVYYHKNCFEKKNKNATVERKTRAVSKVKKLAFGWGIAGGIVALTTMLAILFANNVHPAIAIGVSVFVGYAIFADLYCIICLSYIGEVFLSISGWTIHLPGIIFSFDIEGIIFAIVLKIVLTIFGILFGAFVLLLAITISALLASISFPFILVHNIKTNYKDAVVLPPMGGGARRRGGRR